MSRPRRGATGRRNCWPPRPRGRSSGSPGTRRCRSWPSGSRSSPTRSSGSAPCSVSTASTRTTRQPDLKPASAFQAWVGSDCGGVLWMYHHRLARAGSAWLGFWAGGQVQLCGARRRAMLERFTDQARRVVDLAQEEAKRLNHGYIGTEHILLGLIHEGEGVAAKALELLGISLDAVREQVEEIIGQGQQAPSGHIPFTPRAKKVLELSLRESQKLGHNYIGTEHILLGLIREGDGVAAQVLVRLGADLNRVRQQVIQLLHGYQGKPSAAAGAVESRLSAVEERVGIPPAAAELDQQI